MARFPWIRRLVVSIGIGGARYAVMLGIIVASIIYDRELESVITFASSAHSTHWSPGATGDRSR
jgi:hypothetical protein